MQVCLSLSDCLSVCVCGTNSLITASKTPTFCIQVFVITWCNLGQLNTLNVDTEESKGHFSDIHWYIYISCTRPFHRAVWSYSYAFLASKTTNSDMQETTHSIPVHCKPWLSACLAEFFKLLYTTSRSNQPIIEHPPAQMPLSEKFNASNRWQIRIDTNWR